MKKYKPYIKFPDDIVGKVVKIHNDICVVMWLFGNYNKVSIGARTLTPEDAFNECAFLDGSPVGEEYEEVVKLEHDKVYLVRSESTDIWKARHFHKMLGFDALFYDAGKSSKTVDAVNESSSWNQVCEYSRSIAGCIGNPAEYLIKRN